MIEFVEWSVVAVFEPSEMFQVCNSQQWHNYESFRHKILLQDE